MDNLKVVFMGTPKFAVNILEALIENTDVRLVVSQPDKEVGRKRVLTPSPVKMCALSHAKNVYTPSKIREDYKEIIDCNPDIIVTCAYGQIIPKELLDLPKYGCINVHASLLPKYRGGAPIHRAIMAGDDKTGITIMYMDEHMDSGDIIKKFEIPILDADTLDTLSENLSKLGAEALINTLPSIISGEAGRIKQNVEEVTYAPIIRKSDEHLVFNRTTKEVYDHIRALCENPGAYFVMNNEHIKVYASRMGSAKGEVSCINNIYKDGIGIGTKDGEIILTEIKPEGKKRLSVRDYLNGKDIKRLKGMRIEDEVD